MVSIYKGDSFKNLSLSNGDQRKNSSGCNKKIYICDLFSEPVLLNHFQTKSS